MGSLTHTVSGDIVSFKNAARVPIESLKCHFLPIQEGSGDPSPENVRTIAGQQGCTVYKTGKNLFNIHVSEDPSIWTGANNSTAQRFFTPYTKIIGTSGTNYLQPANCTYSISGETLIINASSGYGLGFAFHLIPNETYTISYTKQDDKMGIAVSSYNKNGDFYKVYEVITNDVVTFTVPSDSEIILITFRPRDRQDAYKVDIPLTNIQLEKGNKATEYESYQGQIIPITFPVLGKNKFNWDVEFTNPDITDTTNASKRIFQPYTYCIGGSYSNYFLPIAVENYNIENGIISVKRKAGYSVYGVSYSLPLISGQTYYLSCTAVSGFIHTAFYDKEGNYLTGSSNNYSNFSFTVPNNAVIGVFNFIPSNTTDIATFSNIQIELGSTATEYTEFSDNNTVYGGYVDIAKGELIATHKFREYDGSSDENWQLSGTNDYVCSQSDVRNDIRNLRPICDKFIMEQTYSSGYPIRPTNNKQQADSVANWRLWLAENPIQVCYELTTPITYPLSKTELTTFLNQNNVWSNTNSTTEVSYAIHDSAPIRAAKHRIAAAEPHLEVPAAANIQHFETDMAAPVKDAKIYFTPKQDLHGQAIPSPVTGKNLLNITQSNKWGNESFTGVVIEKETGFEVPSPYSVNGGFWMPCEPNTTYTYSFDSTYTGQHLHGRVWGFETKITNRTLPTENLLVNLERWPGSQTFTTNNNTYWLLVGCYNNTYSGAFTITNMQVEKNDTATAYEPYKGNFPITGITDCKTIITGKNLLPSGSYTRTASGITFTYNLDGSLHFEGTATATVYLALPTSMYFTIIPGIYTLSADQAPDGWNAYIVVSSANGGDIKWALTSNKTREINYIDTQARFQVVVISGNTVNTTIRPQLEYGEIATSFEQPKNYQIYDIPFDSNIGTIYGGYIDLIKGKLVQTHKKVTIGELSWRTVPSLGEGGWATDSHIPSDMSRAATPISTIYKTINWQHSWSSYQSEEDYSISRYSPSDNLTIVIKDSRYSTVADFIAAQGNTEIVYELATPIEYSIDPQTLKTLRGTNNIWSNANGPIELSYWKH